MEIQSGRGLKGEFMKLISPTEWRNRPGSTGHGATRLGQSAAAPRRIEPTHAGYPSPVSKDKPKTADSDVGPEGADDDVQSDPAKGSEDRADWSDEGGATPSGPAQDTDA